MTDETISKFTIKRYAEGEANTRLIEIKRASQNVIFTSAKLGTLMTINLDEGTITVGENANTTEAAEEFISLVRQTLQLIRS